MTEFDDALRLTACSREGVAFTAEAGGGWAAKGAVNGGFLMALAGSAIVAAVDAAGGHGDVLALSAHFLAATRPGPVDITTEVLRTGRSMSAGQVSVLQDGLERMRALVTLGDLGQRSEPVHRSAPVPDMPGPDDCVPARRDDSPHGADITLLDRLDLRLDPATVGWAIGRPSGRGELRAWVRFADGREPDPTSLLFLLDALPPVSFDFGADGWAPTIEFTAHVRARPAPGWIRASLTSTNVAGGLFEEDACLWDATGRVVAQSRQLAGVRLPAGLPSGRPPDPSAELPAGPSAGLSAELPAGPSAGPRSGPPAGPRSAAPAGAPSQARADGPLGTGA